LLERTFGHLEAGPMGVVAQYRLYQAGQVPIAEQADPGQAAARAVPGPRQGWCLTRRLHGAASVACNTDRIMVLCASPRACGFRIDAVRWHDTCVAIRHGSRPATRPSVPPTR